MMRDIDDIRTLESIARRLEPTPDERGRMIARVVDHANVFLDTLATSPAFTVDEGVAAGLYDSPIEEDPIDIDAALALIRRHVDEPGLNPASGGHLAYIPGGGIFPAALGDFLADVTNGYAGISYTGPGPVRMENLLVRWMADLIDFPAGAGGDLTSGGSIAILSGIVSAREAHGIRARDVHNAVVYTTSQVHHSVDKAIRIAGLGECVRRTIDIDDHYRMRADALAAAVEDDARANLTPWLIVASAGTTDTGAVDPIDKIADVADRHGLWLHVDAAYGGFFALCKEGRHILRGIERAHSVVMDPHKALFLPYGSGAVIVRDRRRLQAAHLYSAGYMQDANESDDAYSPANHSPELTRHFRGLRLWLPLKLFGLAPFRACLEEKLLLARYFHRALGKMDGFEVGPEPDLSVVTYRYVPKQGDPNAFNKRLVDAIRQDGRVFLSSTVLDEKVVLRMCALCFRTHLDTIELTLELLGEKASELEG